MHTGGLLFIKRKCRPEISIDQPIVKKLPQIRKSLPCCGPVLLKIPLSELELVDEIIKNVVSVASGVTESSRSFQTIL
jgi:hypothetical protein